MLKRLYIGILENRRDPGGGSPPNYPLVPDRLLGSTEYVLLAIGILLVLLATEFGRLRPAPKQCGKSCFSNAWKSRHAAQCRGSGGTELSL